MQETPLDQQIQAVRQRIGELTREVPADPGDLLRAAEYLAAAATRAEEERQQLRDLLGSSPDGFVVTDADGRIVDANPAAAALLGEPLAGTLLAACCHPDAQPDIARMLADLRAGRACVSGETTLRSRNGAPVRVAITAAGCGAGEKRWLIRERPPEHPTLPESTEQDRLLARVEEERSLLQAIIEQMPEGVVIAEARREGSSTTTSSYAGCGGDPTCRATSGHSAGFVLMGGPTCPRSGRLPGRLPAGRW